MNLPDLSPAEIRQRYALMCRSTQSTAGERALPQVQDGLNALDALLDDELRALARQGAPDDFADIYLNMQAELELLREFFAYSALGNKNIVAVGGSFSAGKSSLINTLLGQRLLVTEVDPTTALPCFLLRAEADHISAINHFGQRIELSQDEFLSLTHDEEQRYGSQVSRLLRVAYLGYSQFPWPNLALIDTPGYSKSENQSNHNTDAQRARAQLMNAQAIIWVIDARQGCITEDDLRFLSDMPKTTPVLIALSRADQKAASDIPAIISGIKATLKQRSIAYTNVIPVSARKPRDWPLDAVKQQLADWSKQPRRVRFVENFDEQFKRYAQWLRQQQLEASEEQSDLKRMVLMLDDKNTRAAAERLLKASQNRLNILQTNLNGLEALHGKFQQRLIDVAKTAGQDWQSNGPTAEEMFELGNSFYYGNGVSNDSATAAKWFRNAAERGNVEAQLQLALMYVDGDGVSQDYKQAAMWFHKAADQGNVIAQFNLGALYTNGQGVSQNDTQAASWFCKAAEQGDSSAQRILGEMFEEGRGVPQDYEQALTWYLKAVDLGDNQAIELLSLLGDKLKKIDRDLSIKDVAVEDMASVEAFNNFTEKFNEGMKALFKN